MNKKSIKILSLIIIIISTFLVLTGCYNNKINYDSGSKLEENEISKDENKILNEQRLYRDIELEELKQAILMSGSFNKPIVSETTEVKKIYNLTELEGIEAILIREEELNNYQEVAIVKLINEEQCDKIIEKFIYRYEDLKVSEDDHANILFSKENIAIKQQAGVGVFIVSSNKDEIESEINEFFD